MRDNHKAPAPTPSRPAPPATRPWWRRRLTIVLASVAAVVALLALLVVVAPRHIARFVANHYLTGMEIDVEGVKTIDIDLLEGQFSMGPVAFRSGEAEIGKIGLLGVDLSIRDLFEKQALLNSVIVQDVNIDIKQGADGELSINGVSLRQILAEGAKDKPEPEPDSTSSWGAGVDNMRLRNIVVTFTNQAGGTARVDVEHLNLLGFRTWEPNKPGTFVLSGAVNGIDVNAYGTATPFAEKVNANVEFGIDGIALANIEEYTGPLGFDPTDGALTLYGQSAFAVFPEGRLEGTANASLVLANVNAARIGGIEAVLDQGSVVVDGSFAVATDGTITFKGNSEAKLNQAKAKQPNGPALSLSAATLNLSGIDFSMTGTEFALSLSPALNVEKPAVAGPVEASVDNLKLDLPRVAVARQADGALAMNATNGATANQGEPAAGAGHLALASPRLQAPLAFTADSLGVDLAALAVQVPPTGNLTVNTEAVLHLEKAALNPPAQPGQAPVNVRFNGLTAPLGPLAVSTEENKVRLDGPVKVTIDQFELVLPEAGKPASGAKDVTSQTIALSLPNLAIESANGALSVASDGGIDLTNPRVTVPATAGQPPALMNAKGGRVTLSNIQAALVGADVRVEGGIGAELKGVDGTWGGAQATASPRTGGRGQATASEGGRLALDQLTLGLSSLNLRTAGERLTVAGDISTALQGLKATVPGEPRQAPWQVAADKLRVGLNGLDGELLPVLTTGVVKLDVEAGGLAAEQAAPPLPRAPANNSLRVAVKSLQLSPATVGLRTLSDRTAVTGSASARVEGIDMQLPRTDHNPGAVGGIASVRAAISEFTADKAGDTLAWSVRTDVLAERLTNRTEDGKLASVDLRSISIGDLTADYRRKMAIQRVVLDQLRAFLTREYLFASTTQQSRPKEAVEAVQEAAQEGWKFRLGSLGVTDGVEIKLRDTTTEPNTNATIDMQALQVMNLDTGDPSQRTQVRMEATINQFTELSVAGWAAPFGGQPDFDLNARLRRLELPPLSPYAAKAIGVNVESGRLSLDVGASADAGNLKGLLDLTLRDLSFSTLSAADAQRLSASVGVPIETIVGLLQDDQGRIKLSLPISGNLANPAFDPTDAIRQALTGALQAAVLAPFQLAFAPVALIAKAAGAGGNTMGLQPVPFSAGVAKLEGTSADMVSGLARVLQERDKLQIKVCGRATASDLTAALRADGAPESGPERDAAVERLAPDLWSLAGERTARVRDALINDGGASARQVGECRVVYDPTDTGPPRVEVTL